MAGALGAYKVMFLTDVAGWLRDPADPAASSPSDVGGRGEAELAGVAGGMRPKLAACVDAIERWRLARRT